MPAITPDMFYHTDPTKFYKTVGFAPQDIYHLKVNPSTKWIYQLKTGSKAGLLGLLGLLGGGLLGSASKDSTKGTLGGMLLGTGTLAPFIASNVGRTIGAKHGLNEAYRLGKLLGLGSIPLALAAALGGGALLINANKEE